MENSDKIIYPSQDDPVYEFKNIKYAQVDKQKTVLMLSKDNFPGLNFSKNERLLFRFAKGESSQSSFTMRVEEDHIPEDKTVVVKGESGQFQEIRFIRPDVAVSYEFSIENP